MEGPVTLTEKEVDRVVTKTSAGVYILDRTSPPQQTFCVYYAGRSDVDVNARLKNHVGNYNRFKFEYHSSPKVIAAEAPRSDSSIRPRLKPPIPARATQ